mmetsp:Transcript_11337/g.25178  ORF Transcript_11337/g.25178 Transcript_11337/m.25178 type:complete len:359 (+) Transcript_11337:83-1159(+)|eukprot:CAMPEP_0204258238 /NCGR_PEP_ID=MMETSP0468-20130131/4879_1 /ASSEMBLY_ACC=CAM_ASM_000383 /TAXON_ID=2969 /ORGANISM="Oxyrrhis marina" /LENGTH=358 /DNA_ID=CAMNT_0051232419 /DNA_START=24 /DNA_END=1100 /DNA_ORIENTATION=-
MVAVVPLQSLAGLDISILARVVAGVHFLINVNLLSCLSSIEPIFIVGTKVQVWQQLITAVHILIGFPLICAGIVGSLWRLQRLMEAYFYYVVQATLVLIGFLVLFAQQGPSCETSSFGLDLEYRMSCGLSGWFSSTVALLPLLPAMGAAFVAWSAAAAYGEIVPELLMYKEALQRSPPPEKFVARMLSAARNPEKLPLTSQAWKQPASALPSKSILEGAGRPLRSIYGLAPQWPPRSQSRTAESGPVLAAYPQTDASPNGPQILAASVGSKSRAAAAGYQSRGVRVGTHITGASMVTMPPQYTQSAATPYLNVSRPVTAAALPAPVRSTAFDQKSAPLPKPIKTAGFVLPPPDGLDPQ